MKLVLFILTLCIICIRSSSPLSNIYKAGSDAHKAEIGLEWQTFTAKLMKIKPNKGESAYRTGYYGLYFKDKQSGDYTNVAFDHYVPDEPASWNMTVGDKYAKFVAVFQPGNMKNNVFFATGPLIRTKERSISKINYTLVIIGSIIGVIVIIVVFVGCLKLANKKCSCY